MSLRCITCLLAVLGSCALAVADDGSVQLVESPDAQRRTNWGQGVLIYAPGSDATATPTIAIDLFAPFFEQIRSVHREAMSHQVLQPSQAFHDASNGAVFDHSHEFPFSPRRLHQLNYDAPNPGATVVFDDFPNSDFLFQLGNTVISESLLPVIMPTAGRASEGVYVIQQAAGAACNSDCADSAVSSGDTCAADDDCPIDVEFADIDDPGEAPRPLTHVPEPPPGLPMCGGFDGFDCLFDFAQAAYAKPAIVSSPNTAGESCSHAEPPLKAKVEHLLEAARHLAGAGYEDEAKLFRVEAEAIQRASTRLLTEKRQELERLQREIAELEALTGQYTMIQLKCQILEVTLPEGCATDPRLELLTKAGYCIVGNRPHADACETAASCKCGDDVTDLLGILKNHDCATVKTIAEPTLITNSGRTATLRSGGEFPVLIPVSGTAESPAAGDARIEWKDFGVMLQAVPHVLGNGKLRLSLDAEVSERDFSNPVSLAGSVVPGLTTRRSRTDIETSFGDTVVVRCCSSATETGEKTLLMLVTAVQIEPLPEPQPNPQSGIPGPLQWTR